MLTLRSLDPTARLIPSRSYPSARAPNPTPQTPASIPILPHHPSPGDGSFTAAGWSLLLPCAPSLPRRLRLRPRGYRCASPPISPTRVADRRLLRWSAPRRQNSHDCASGRPMLAALGSLSPVRATSAGHGWSVASASVLDATASLYRYSPLLPHPNPLPSLSTKP